MQPGNGHHDNNVFKKNLESIGTSCYLLRQISIDWYRYLEYKQFQMLTLILGLVQYIGVKSTFCGLSD